MKLDNRGNKTEMAWRYRHFLEDIIDGDTSSMSDSEFYEYVESICKQDEIGLYLDASGGHRFHVAISR